MYSLIKIRHNILIQCHRNYMEVWQISIRCFKLNFFKFIPKNFGCPKRWFLWVWVSKTCPDTLLAMTMCPGSRTFPHSGRTWPVSSVLRYRLIATAWRPDHSLRGVIRSTHRPLILLSHPGTYSRLYQPESCHHRWEFSHLGGSVKDQQLFWFLALCSCHFHEIQKKYLSKPTKI